jgi:hypothetical protein
MGNLAVSDKAINKYFHFLRKLDKNSKERLIVKLRESIDTEKYSSVDLKNIFGAWDDTRESDEIISEIKKSRINPKDTERFE